MSKIVVLGLNSHAATLEIVICAAVRASNGKIVRGRRHNVAIRGLQAMQGYEGEQPEGDDQGFVTSTNRFVNRKEANRIHFPDYTEPAEAHGLTITRDVRSVQVDRRQPTSSSNV